MSNDDNDDPTKLPPGQYVISNPLGTIVLSGPTGSASANSVIAMMRSLEGKTVRKTDADHMEQAMTTLAGMNRGKRDALERMAEKAVPSGFGVDDVPLGVLKAVLESMRGDDERDAQQQAAVQSQSIQRQGNGPLSLLVR